MNNLLDEINERVSIENTKPINLNVWILLIIEFSGINNIKYNALLIHGLF